LTGRIIYTENFSAGNKNLKLNIDNKLSKGMYIVILIADGKTMLQSFFSSSNFQLPIQTIYLKIMKLNY
jgi:hypothetical protein